MTQYSAQNANENPTMSTGEPLEQAAGSLRDLAQRVRERSGASGLPGVDRAAAAVAQPLESSARYLEQNRPADAWADVMAFCREHPAGALGIGFVLGYVARKLLP
jgi:hypothetical protein